MTPPIDSGLYARDFEGGGEFPIKNLTVDFCIYCGRRATTDEHPMPKWLGGTKILALGSCLACAEVINREIENPHSKGLFWYARRHYNLVSSGSRNDTLSVQVVRADGHREFIKVSPEENPGALGLPTLPEAAIYQYESPTEITGTYQRVIKSCTFDTERYKTFCKKYMNKGDFLVTDVNTTSLCRLLAKISLGTAALIVGPSKIKPIIQRFIMSGDIWDAYYYVGAFETPPPTPLKDEIHVMAVGIKSIRNIPHVVVGIQLFAKAQMPMYEVIVGEYVEHNSSHATRLAWSTHAPLFPAIKYSHSL